MIETNTTPNQSPPFNPYSKSLSLYRLTNGPSPSSPKSPNQTPSSCFEIRLFYVRFSPCVIDSVPQNLTITHLRREQGVSLEINNSRIPCSENVDIKLRRDRVNAEASEVTYVSTDTVRVSGPVEFEVYEDGDKGDDTEDINNSTNTNVLLLCGSLEKMDSTWGYDAHKEGAGTAGWSMDCYTAVGGGGGGGSAFFQPKMGVTSPSIEVYVAGCCSGVPLILTKTIQVSPRRKHSRHKMLDAIPEDEETAMELGKGKMVNGNGSCENGSVRQRKQLSDPEVEEYDQENKMLHGFYSEDMYMDEDGQLTWFNAGVRVGVGIGLGMCLGVGIGVGLLMRSYQATTRTFRRRFF